MDLKNKRVMVTGGSGFLGSYIVEKLRAQGCRDVFVVRSERDDLRDDSDTADVYRRISPDIVIHAAAHAGGIGLNQVKPADLFYDNAMMGINMIHHAAKHGVEKFVRSEPSAVIRNSPRLLSRKRVCGTATQKKPTLLTASPKRLCWFRVRLIVSSTV